MSELYEVTTTRAHVLRHAPARGQGLDAALVDIAQDLLLRHLHDSGLLDELVFKGGTALRKLYAGSRPGSPWIWTSRCVTSAPTPKRSWTCSPSR